MSTDLREGLHRLADEGAAGHAPTDLWQRGKRRQQRRRRTGALAAAAAVLVAVSAGVIPVVTSAPRPGPATPVGTPGIPQRLQQPSPWTPGTASAGPLGPLAVVAEAPRHVNWFQAPMRPYGVSAATGTYRFLDLPDFAPATPSAADTVALSPDGRHVGYWIQGTTPKRQPDFQGPTVVGFASYDTVTGAVTRHRVPTERGVDGYAMMWVNPSTLLVSYGHLTSQPGTSHGDGTFLWTPTTGALRKVPGRAAVFTGFPRAAPGGFLTFGSGYVNVWTLPSLQLRRYRVGVDVQDAVIDPTGTRIAVKSEPPGHVVLNAGRLPTMGNRIRTHSVDRPSRSVYDLLGWRDPAHFIAEVGYGLNAGVALVSVDVHTGDHRIIGYDGVGYYDYATDLWSRPLVDRPGPPTELDPRMVAVVVAFLVLSVGGGVLTLLARRRRGA